MVLFCKKSHGFHTVSGCFLLVHSLKLYTAGSFSNEATFGQNGENPSFQISINSGAKHHPPLLKIQTPKKSNHHHFVSKGFK